MSDQKHKTINNTLTASDWAAIKNLRLVDLVGEGKPNDLLTLCNTLVSGIRKVSESWKTLRTGSRLQFGETTFEVIRQYSDGTLLIDCGEQGPLSKSGRWRLEELQAKGFKPLS